MMKRYSGLALIAAMVFAHQTSSAIHLKDKEGNFISYDQEKREITTTKEESKAARFMITPVWGHDKGGMAKRLGKLKKAAKSKEDAQHQRHFKLLLHNKGSSVLFPMGWNGTTLFVPRKSPAEFCPQDGQPKGEGKGKGASKGAKGKKSGLMQKGKGQGWKKFGKMVVCTIEGIKVTPDTTNDQLDEVKVIFTFKEGKKEVVKELFFEKGAEEKHKHEVAKETPKEVAKETKEETTKKEEVKEEQKAKEEAAH